MIDRVDPAQSCIREAVCIHTKKIYDSCRDKDCVEDLRVYPTRSSQAVLDRTASVRGTKAELLCVDVDVEPASYNRGYYTTDIRYYYRITADAYCGGSRPAEIQGLAGLAEGVVETVKKPDTGAAKPAQTPNAPQS